MIVSRFKICGVLLAGVVLIAACAKPEQPVTTDLHSAAEQGDFDRVQELILGGADVNARDSGGWTPLHAAVLGGNRRIVRLLIQEGADVKAADKDGDTPADFTTDRKIKDMLRPRR